MENIAPDDIFVTGNSVIDALMDVSRRIDTNTRMNAELAKAFPSPITIRNLFWSPAIAGKTMGMASSVFAGRWRP